MITCKKEYALSDQPELNNIVRHYEGITVAGGDVLGIRLRSHNHPPQQRAIRLAFHHQATDELRGNDFGGE